MREPLQEGSKKKQRDRKHAAITTAKKKKRKLQQQYKGEKEGRLQGIKRRRRGQTRKMALSKFQLIKHSIPSCCR